MPPEGREGRQPNNPAEESGRRSRAAPFADAAAAPVRCANSSTSRTSGASHRQKGPQALSFLEATYGRLHQEALQEGIAIGTAKGVAEGEARGKVEGRAGPPDDATIARVPTAAPADIELWAIAVLSAPTLAAVFEAGWAWTGMARLPRGGRAFHFGTTVRR